jgi:hypothetical protein
MSEFERMSYQRAISEAYRMSELYIPLAIKRLGDMIETLAMLQPSSPEELHTGAMAVVEEFANDQSPTP